jgi:hypothetical protein
LPAAPFFIAGRSRVAAGFGGAGELFFLDRRKGSVYRARAPYERAILGSRETLHVDLKAA